MSEYIQNIGQYKTIVDGNIIDNKKWNMIYNGDEFDLEAEDNDKLVYMKLSNDEIIKLLEVPSQNLSLSQRLQNDLNNNVQFRPIIIENTKYKKSNTKKHKKKHKKKHSLKHAPQKIPSSRKYTISKKHSSRKNSSPRNRKTVTPDYLKTIY